MVAIRAMEIFQTIKPKKTFRAVKRTVADLGDKYTDGLGYLIARIEKNQKVTKAVDQFCSSFKKPTARIMDFTSVLYTLMTIRNTAASKKIKKERKPMLIINAGLTTLVSSTAAAIIDGITDPFLTKLADSYNAVDRSSEGWLSKISFKQGLERMKSISIFTLIVRLAVPVLMVPITGAIVKKMEARKKAKIKEEKLKKFEEANPELMEQYKQLQNMHIEEPGQNRKAS